MVVVAVAVAQAQQGLVVLVVQEIRLTLLHHKVIMVEQVLTLVMVAQVVAALQKLAQVRAVERQLVEKAVTEPDLQLAAHLRFMLVAGQVLVIPEERAELAVVAMELVQRQATEAMEPPILEVAVVGELQEVQHHRVVQAVQVSLSLN